MALLRVAGRTGALLAACTVVLLSAEAAARILGPDDLVPQTYPPELIDARDGRAPHVSRAGFDGLVRGHRARVDAHHFRAMEGDFDGRPRVLLLGDSVLFGPGLEDFDSPGPVLQRILGGAAQVANASTLGWSSEHELAYLMQFGDQVAPGALVLGYCLNDPLPAAAPVFADARRGDPWGGPLRSANLFLRKHSLGYVWLKGALGAERREHGFRAYAAPLFEGAFWDSNRRTLLAMHAWSSERGIPFLVAVFPMRDQLEVGSSASGRPQDLLIALGKEAGFPVADLREDLLAEDFLVADPIHLDARGIRKSMERIASELDEMDWVSRAPGLPGGPGVQRD